MEQIKRVIEDNFHYFSIKTYVVGTHWNCLAEAILMSTHNICFYGEIMKIILQLSPSTHHICSTGLGMIFQNFSIKAYVVGIH